LGLRTGSPSAFPIEKDVADVPTIKLIKGAVGGRIPKGKRPRPVEAKGTEGLDEGGELRECREPARCTDRRGCRNGLADRAGTH
jgi:hypothetical protein